MEFMLKVMTLISNHKDIRFISGGTGTAVKCMRLVVLTETSFFPSTSDISI